MAVLIGMSGKIQGQTFQLQQDVMTVGRDKNMDINLDIASISSRHASITREGNRYTLRDLDSTNGTMVNGTKIKIAQLKPKDILLLGSVEFMFDGEDIEVDEDNVVAATQVIVGTGRAAAPKSFQSISPFGARREESKGTWLAIVIFVGLLALAGLVWLFLALFRAS